MSDRKYTLPGLEGWTFAISAANGTYLWSPGGWGVDFKGASQDEEIAERVQEVLRQTADRPELAAAIKNIDWKAMLGKQPALVAPLLNVAPVTPVKNNISSEQLDKIYNNLETAYYAIKAFDPRTSK